MNPLIKEQLDEAVANCMKCGFCKAACPVFLGEETTTPRAKVRLARAVANGDLELTPRIKEIAERCLNCRACASECPSGVEPNKIALALRAAYVELDGLPMEKRLLFHNVISNPCIMNLCRNMASAASSALFLRSSSNPLRNVLPLFGLRKDKHLPKFGPHSLTSLVSEITEPASKQIATVLYFPGCAITHIYPEVGVSVVNILRKLGAKVILPKNLTCCSTPVFNSGDIDAAKRMALRNMEIISSINPDFIITSCGSCGLTIKHEWNDVLGLDTSGIDEKVLDISEFAVKYMPSNIKALDTDITITYHDSCHLCRGMGVKSEPRQLLKAIPGIKYVEMDSADRCCGGGGTFSIYHDNLSQQVADVKMQSLASTGADIITAGCPACIMQLTDSIEHRRMKQKVMHTAQIIDKHLLAPTALT